MMRTLTGPSFRGGAEQYAIRLRGPRSPAFSTRARPRPPERRKNLLRRCWAGRALPAGAASPAGGLRRSSSGPPAVSVASRPRLPFVPLSRCGRCRGFPFVAVAGGTPRTSPRPRLLRGSASGGHLAGPPGRRSVDERKLAQSRCLF